MSVERDSDTKLGFVSVEGSRNRFRSVAVRNNRANHRNDRVEGILRASLFDFLDFPLEKLTVTIRSPVPVKIITIDFSFSTSRLEIFSNRTNTFAAGSLAEGSSFPAPGANAKKRIL